MNSNGCRWSRLLLRKSTPGKKLRGWLRKSTNGTSIRSLEKLEDRCMMSVLGDDAYQLLIGRSSRNEEALFVFKDVGSAFNHGETGLFSSPSPTKLVTIAANCVFAPSLPGRCASDLNTLDRSRGTVLRMDVVPLVAGQFAGMVIQGTNNVPTGLDLTGATQLVFEASTSNPLGQSINIGIGDTSVTISIPAGSSFTTFSIPLSSLQGPNANLKNLATLFSAGVSDVQAVGGAHVYFDNIRFQASPSRQQTELSLPLSTETYGVIIEKGETNTSQHPVYPLDQVLANTATVYESSMTALSLLHRGQPNDLLKARRIVDTLVYVQSHDLTDNNQIPPSGTARGLHDAYQAGDIANGPGSSAGGQVRLTGFSVGQDLEKFYLVQDGANGGNNAFAILALLAAYRTFHDTKYLDSASSIGNWIVGTLKDSSPLTESFGGYFFGFNQGGAANNGQSPRVLNKSKSIENNADIFAGLTQLALAEQERGNPGQAAFWTENANYAGDFVMRLYDPATGRFYSGTAPAGTPPSTGVTPSGPSRTNEIVNVFDYLDAQSFVTLALSGSARYRNSIDWRRPVQYMLAHFDQTVSANGQQFQGFSLTTEPIAAFPRQPSAKGVSWEFTGQVITTMAFVDALYGKNEFTSQIAFYRNEMRRAQTLAPYTDGIGLVAATLDGENVSSSPFLPINQCLTTPFQDIPERVALAATNWAVFADLAYNLFAFPSLPSISISLSSPTMVETNGSVTLTASLSAASALDVTVDLAFSGTAANVLDYQRSATQIVIPAGTTTRSITLTSVSDTIAEVDETIVVDISGATNSEKTGTQRVTETIVDDDRPVANAGGPYVIDAGTNLILNGSGSTGHGTLSYQWDLNNDNTPDITSQTVTTTVPWLTLANLGLGPGNHSIQLIVSDGTFGSPNVSASLVVGTNFFYALDGAATLSLNGSEIEIRDSAPPKTLLSHVRSTGLQQVTIVGSANSDTMTVDYVNGDPLPTGGISFSGAGGSDTLLFNGRNLSLDLSAPSRFRLSNVEVLNLIGTGPNSVKITYDDVVGATDANHILSVITDTDDSVNIGAGWRIDTTVIENGKFARILKQGVATLRLFGPRDWNNPANRLDVNASGTVSPIDALLIINELNRPLYSLNRQLLNPLSLSSFPGIYFDANADGFIAPLDVLLVINFLNTRTVAGEGEGMESLQPYATACDAILASTAFPQDLSARLSSTAALPNSNGSIQPQSFGPTAYQDLDSTSAEIGSTSSQSSYLDWIYELIGEEELHFAPDSQYPTLEYDFVTNQLRAQPNKMLRSGALFRSM